MRAGERGEIAGVFLVSLAAIHLELLATRVLSLVLWHHLSYLVITFAMLGFAAGGTALGVLPRLQAHRPVTLAWSSMGLAVTAVLALASVSLSPHDAVDLLRDRVRYLIAPAYYAHLLLPFFCAGLAIATALTGGERTPTMYAANLSGSALGALAFVLLLRPLGAPGSVLAVALAASLGALCLAGGAKTRAAAAGLVLLALLGLFPGRRFAEERLFAWQPAPSKAMVEQHLESEATWWDPICRVDVVRSGGEHKRIFQDGDAPTLLVNGRSALDLDGSLHALAYGLLHEPSVLVIGAGGGLDLWTARHHHARSIAAVEINASTAALMRGAYREFSGGIYDLPADERSGGVHVLVEDGRTLVRRSTETYDLIQMTGTDTYTALACGAYVMAESYLYTREAFEDYLRHLSPGGLLAVVRFGFEPPRESLRLCATAVAAMQRLGHAHPEREVIVVQLENRLRYRGELRVIPYAAMLFKNGELRGDEVATVEDFVRSRPGQLSLAYAPGARAHPVFERFFAAVGRDAASVERFFDEYPFDVRPTTDDRPFFFQFHRWSAWRAPVEHPDWYGMVAEDPVALWVLSSALVQAIVLTLLLIVLPLHRARRAIRIDDRPVRVLVYFLAIGAGYLLFELASIQKLALYLGHPAYSMATVLATFLLGSGAGSWLLGRTAKVRPLLALIVLVSALEIVLVPRLLGATAGAGLALRVTIASAALAPLAFLLGVPFPAVLDALKRRGSSLAPLAWGANASASVIASVLGIIGAMALGFDAVLWVAAGTYAVAWLAASGFPAVTPLPGGAAGDASSAPPAPGRR